MEDEFDMTLEERVDELSFLALTLVDAQNEVRAAVNQLAIAMIAVNEILQSLECLKESPKVPNAHLN